MEKDIRALLWKMSLDADYLFPGGDPTGDEALVGTVVSKDEEDILTDEPTITNSANIGRDRPTLRRLDDVRPGSNHGEVIYCHVCKTEEDTDEAGQAITTTIQIQENWMTGEVTEMNLNSTTGITERTKRTTRPPSRHEEEGYSNTKASKTTTSG